MGRLIIGNLELGAVGSTQNMFSGRLAGLPFLVHEKSISSSNIARHSNVTGSPSNTCRLSGVTVNWNSHRTVSVGGRNEKRMSVAGFDKAGIETSAREKNLKRGVPIEGTQQNKASLSVALSTLGCSAGGTWLAGHGVVCSSVTNF